MDKYANYLQRSILFFWAIWFTLVSISDGVNLCEVLNASLLHSNFNSKNYELIMQCLAHYHLNNFLLAISIFTAIILFSVIIAMVFWYAFINSHVKLVFYAFLLSFYQTGFFIMADEVFIQYPLEHGHMIRLLTQMVSYWLCWTSSKPR